MLTLNEKRALALNAFLAAIKAADPKEAIERHLSKWLEEEGVNVSSIIPIAVGKAAIPLMQGLLSVIPSEKLKQKGLVITNRENHMDIDGAEVLVAGHPLPDEQGLIATQKLIEIISDASDEDHILFCVSGGASAMLPAPLDSISLADKIATTDLLLASGADIVSVNTVRKHLSKIKGGGVVKLAAPARITSFILSDVIGDDLSSIASGPTVADETTFQDAENILRQFHIWDKVPQSVRDVLGAADEETLKPDDPRLFLTQNYLIGSNAVSVEAAMNYLSEAGVELLETPYPLEGNAREEAVALVSSVSAIPSTDQVSALVTGGETTVNLIGDGKGGRNQEFALAFMLYAMEKRLPHEWVCLSGGTDGRDGPTDAAGGITDKDSFMRMMKKTRNPVPELENNNAYEALKASEDLIMTGGTGTNVADIQIVLI
ncbi:glycerate kinase type-2 family protein [Curvivirga sp.]|uniref:glycerate kinase type-2 family protein n=1 Tax=Curvivirga sp. TaxID=2856848 RepID=UPI003B5A2800